MGLWYPVGFYKESDPALLSLFNIDRQRTCRKAHWTHFPFTPHLSNPTNVTDFIKYIESITFHI